MRRFPRSAGSHLKCFDDVGHKDFVAIKSGFLERAIKEKSGASDERVAGRIFAISRYSPTNITVAPRGPSPSTACVAFFQRSQALYGSTAFRVCSRCSSSALRKSAAVEASDSPTLEAGSRCHVMAAPAPFGGKVEE